MKPTIAAERIHVLDLIRGFALIGLPFVNVLTLWRNVNLSGTQADIWIQRFLYIFVEGRFYAIFSFLFGVGFWIFLSRAEEKGDRPYILFIRRMVILLAAGLLHSMLNPGEALAIYAVFGLLVLLFYRAPKQVNLLLGLAGVVAGSILTVKVLLPLPLILLGLAFGQYQVFRSLEKSKKSWMAVAVVSFLATALLTFFLWQKAPDNGLYAYVEGVSFDISDEQFESNRAFYEFADVSMMVAPVYSILYVSVLVLLTSIAGKWMKPLYSFGRMALTNYIGQSIILVFLAAFIPANPFVSYQAAAIICALMVGVQILFSSLWLKYFHYGPLEWLWRCGTYWDWVPIRKSA